jgi:hypothetical protein
MEVEGQDATVGALGRPEYHRSGAVGENHSGASTPAADVHAGRLNLGAHHQNASVQAGLDPRVCHGQRVDEAAALCPHVQRRNRVEAEIALEVHAISWGEVIRRRGRIHDRVELRRRYPCRFEGPVRGAERQLGTGLSFANPAALLDAGTRPNPLVGRVHDR